MNMRSQGASVYPYEGKYPNIADNVFIADGVRIVGNVSIGQRASLWYNAVIRGDVHWVRIGEDTNVQDNCLLHVTHDTAPLTVGKGVTVGHSVILHGCTVGNFCLIGMGAVVLDHAVVEDYSFVAAGAVVTPGFVVPKHKLVAGVPAKVIRDLRPEEIADLPASAERYIAYAEQSWRDIRDQNI